MTKRPSIIFAASLLLVTVLACALPGGQAASVPPPTVDPAQLNSIIAETVSAALEQTALAPTATQPVTATSEPAMESTNEPEATATPSEQNTLSDQGDGTIFFADEIGFNLSVPPGWLPVRIGQPEYYDAFSLPQAADANVQAALMKINDLDPNVYRLFIFDLQDGHLQSGFVNNINFVFTVNESLSIKTDEEIKKTAEALPSSVPGLVVTSSSISNTANNILVGEILSEITGQKADETKLELFQKQIFLNVKQGLVVITFTTEAGIKDATLPFFDTMIDSIHLGE